MSCMLKGWYDLAFEVVTVQLAIDHCDSRGYILILYAVQGDILSNTVRVNVLKHC